MEPSAMATEYLEAELVAHAAWEAAGLARMLAVLAEFDRRQGWAQWQCRSAQHWLSWKCGLGYTAASERLRVAHALPLLPVIAEAFAAGRLSWSKVRELTRVATPADEHKWCNVGEYTTAAQLSRLTAAARRVTGRDAARQVERRGLSWVTEVDGSITITLRAPADQAVAVLAVVKAATVPVKGVRWAQTAADTLVDLVLGDRQVRTEIIVHVDTNTNTHTDNDTGSDSDSESDSDSADVHAYFDDGPAIAPEIAECLGCDGSVTTIVGTPTGPVTIDTRKAPSPRQRRALALRHRTCQMPGCHHAGKFHAHHVIERGKGGPTRLRNLIRVCWFHHRMIHIHGLLLTLHRDRSLTVTDRHGTPIDKPLPKLDFHVQPPTRPDLIGQWQGDTMNINDCLTAVGIH